MAQESPMSEAEQLSRACRSFRNDDADLRPISEWFRHFARANGLSEPRMLNLELCLNELVTNIVHYAYADWGRHRIQVSLEHQGEELRVTIEDDGRPFNPLEKAPPEVPDSLESARVGGWGIPIVRALADDISYERRDGRNRVTIVSRYPSKPI
jgi:anti-sigma regulatory factor (Ser/Thr protein kinase)